jgi:hypothetical protein
MGAKFDSPFQQPLLRLGGEKLSPAISLNALNCKRYCFGHSIKEL